MTTQVSGLSFSYGNRLVLKDISFSIQPSQLLSIIGPNGVGKSTLFRCILGLMKNYQGEILINNQDIRDLDVRERAQLIAYIPQSHHPYFNYSVFDMVLMGTSVKVSVVSSPGQKQLDLVDYTLERLEISHLKNRGYTQISGGEQQLVLLARALVQEAKILILDEPTANLDFGNQFRVMAQIKSLAEEGYTIIQATHNPDQAFLYSDQVLAMKNGKVVTMGTPAEIFTADLIQTLYGVDVELQSLFDGKVKVCMPKCVCS